MSFIHANDAAMGDSGYARIDADFYPTEPWVTKAVIPHLLEMRPPTTPIWEPACGDGAMAAVLKQHFDTVACTDLHDRGYGRGGIDFLTQRSHTSGLIVTNPPFGDLAEAFIRHALKTTERLGGGVALLLRHEYDCGKSRIGLFNKPPFARRVILTSRPRWIAGSTGSPRHNYAWFLWDWTHKGPAQTFYALRGK